MYKAEISFVLYKITGVWPMESSCKAIVVLSNVFNIFVFTVTILFTLSNLLYIFIEHTDMEEFNDNLFYLLALFVGCLKMVIAFNYRDEIIQITNILHNEQFVPQDRSIFKVQYGSQKTKIIKNCLSCR